MKKKIKYIFLTLFLPFLYLLLWILFKTLRCTWSPLFEKEITSKRLYEKTIFVYWHDSLLIFFFLGAFKNISLLVSSSASGRLLSKFVHLLGYNIIFGSSSRKGVEALLKMIRLSAGAYAFAADGPRGPLHKAKRGFFFLANSLGYKIVPLSCSLKSFWTLKTWDRLRVPKPFSKVCFETDEKFFQKNPPYDSDDFLQIIEFLNLREKKIPKI